MTRGYPMPQGLYDPTLEHDSCGIGFVAHIKGKPSHDIVERGIEVLERMEHRGAESADNKTGDGAGILMQIPHRYFSRIQPDLPEQGGYGTGLLFLPKNNSAAREEMKKVVESALADENLSVLAWRDVPTDSTVIGEIAARSEPYVVQAFITPSGSVENLERALYIARKTAERNIRESSIEERDSFYIVSLSSQTIIYKGMLMPDQIKTYYPDLQDNDFESAIALVHSRFSTNTFPAWELAQPFRMVAHNGEINTVKGNRFWMQARETMFESKEYGDEIKKILPVIEPDRSDSASFDNALEMLVETGRSLPHSLMMLVPESWNDKNPIPQDLKAFYEYHSTFMEPWDGPASMVFCDGRYVGGTLDRNGLRPSRYVVTKDDLIVMGSEVGVQEFDPENIALKGRLRPGKILLVDTEEGRIIPDEEIKQQIAHAKPYQEWVEKNRVNLADVEVNHSGSEKINTEEIKSMHRIYGYNREDIEDILIPMVAAAQEPTGSMGTDTPLAVFSDKPQRLFNYFKQTFAQVTNPAIDPIREELVMSLTSYIGGQQNLLSETEEHCRVIKFTRPFFSNTDMQKVRSLADRGFPQAQLDITYDIEKGHEALDQRMKELSEEAEALVDKGIKLLILSDKNTGNGRAPIPSLLATSGIHHHLIRAQKRTRCSLITETAEAREVMHFAVLFGYGADAINPYGALATLKWLHQEGDIPEIEDYHKVVSNYMKSLRKGLLKVLSKMGTSTLRSYRGAQIFEAIGLGDELVDRFFTGTRTRIKGIGLKEIHEEIHRTWEKAHTAGSSLLESEGVYNWRRKGEKHAWNPETIHLLQWSTREGDYEKYRQFAEIANQENRRPHVIRGLFDFKNATHIPIEEVESEEAIYRRFTTGAMSFGSLSKEVHEAMAIAMNKLGGRSNSGEGGEDPERFTPRPDGTLARSAIKQIASGRFGVTSNYLTNADEIQIKISQGAKPGEGGQLPGHKVDRIIAKTRYSTPGVTLISPPPHHDIYSIEDLAQLIFDLKNANPSAKVSVKLVSETGVGTVAAGVAKAHADLILISGYDGGTGASPQSSIKHAGLPWELGLSETHQTLVMNDLRGRVRLQTDGQLKTGRDVVLAAMMGAEEFGFGTSALIVLGCVMMRKCHLNTCPVGVATQNPDLRARFRGKPEYLVNYFTFMAREVREILASLGMRSLDEVIGRSDLLLRREIKHWKASTVDPSLLLHIPEEATRYDTRCVKDQIHKIDDVLDRKLIKNAKNAIENKEPVKLEEKIINIDRSTGAMLSHEISKRYGLEGLPDDTIHVTFHGSAGQSFGAFLAPGVTFRLEGDANDYFGKGLSGGRLIAVPPKGSTFTAEENIIIGNTVLYGATAGEVFVRGVAGERFCVRNSGVTAVVEGTGDHCAEYMTGGLLLVLGTVGRNFGAAMSGGIAYVLDEKGDFEYYCNKGMIELSQLKESDDIDTVKELIQRHCDYTGSTRGQMILDNWEEFRPKFVKVFPLEYKRALEEMKLEALDKQLQDVRDEEEMEVLSDG